MKKYIHIFIFLFVQSLFVRGQSAAENKEVFTIVEEQAVFPGGIQEMMKFIQKNINYPQAVREANIGGKSFLKFIVNEDGSVSNVEVLKSSGVDALDNEAVRVVQSMPNWKAARMTGREVKCYFNLPIGFVLDDVYFVFNPNNRNENYLMGKQAVLTNKINDAMSFFQKAVGDIDAWYCMGVISYMNKDKVSAKRYFENVKLSGDRSQTAFQMSEKFLAKCL